MKKGIAVLATALVLTLGISWLNSADAQAKKGEKGFIVGTVIDLATYGMKGQIEEVAEAHKNRVEHGFPVGILEEETGEIWICVFRNSAPASHLELGNKKLAEFAAMKVVCQGLKYQSKNINVIRFSTVSEY
jgi:hypothetical protein